MARLSPMWPLRQPVPRGLPAGLRPFLRHFLFWARLPSTRPAFLGNDLNQIKPALVTSGKPQRTF